MPNYCELQEVTSHMQRDLELLTKYETENIQEPILFFYTWDEIAVTVGKAQRSRDFIVQECESRSIPVYHRPTGGKAVLHGGDICYSFIARQNDTTWGGTLNESFAKVNSYIRKLFVEALELDAYDIQTTETCVGDQDAANCFAHSVRSETVFQEHKLIGAAQHMGRSHFLQQGSMQINPVHCNLEIFRAMRSLSQILGKSDYDLGSLLASLNERAIL